MAQGNTKLARRLIWFAAFVNVALLLMMCTLSNGGSGGLWAFLLLLIVDGSVGAYALTQGLAFEWQQERTWKAVCGGIGGNFKGEGMSVVRSVREGVASRGRYHVPTQTKTIYPKLRDVHGTYKGWTGNVTPFAGQTVDNYTDHADSFALAFHVPFITFDIAENGLISVRAGTVPIPDAYNHPGRPRALQAAPTPGVSQVAPPARQRKLRRLPPADTKTTLSRVKTGPLLPAVSTVAAELALLKSVPMAQDLYGRTCYMPIEGQHWFIAARTGGGKGSWIWSLVLGLAPAWQAGLVKFWGCDPKRLELAIGREWWAHYADTDMGMVELLESAVREMFAVGDSLKGRARKFTPSQQTPLNVIVIDELGYMSSMLTDKKLQMRALSAIKTLLTQGRSNGYAVVGAVQDPRKETVGFREEFPIRIAGCMSAPMVDLVLGDGMHDAGALCEQIPIGNVGAGVAYVINETSLKPLCVRAAWCGDEIIQRLLGETGRVERAEDAAQAKDEYPIPQYQQNGQPLQQFLV